MRITSCYGTLTLPGETEAGNPGEASILRFRYGLTDGRAHTLEETGRQFSLTRERIRQIEKDAMKRLREYVNAHERDFRA